MTSVCSRKATLLVICFATTALLPTSTQLAPDECSLGCVGNELSQLRSLQKSLALTSILDPGQPDPREIMKQYRKVCSAHMSYDGCIRSCPPSEVKNFIQMSLSVAKYICKDNSAVFNKLVLPCYHRYSRFIDQRCVRFKKTKNEQLGSLYGDDKRLSGQCTKIIHLESCTRHAFERYCGAQVASFIWGVQKQQHLGMAQTLRVMPIERRQELPTSCRQMLSFDRRALDLLHASKAASLAFTELTAFLCLVLVHIVSQRYLI